MSTSQPSTELRIRLSRPQTLVRRAILPASGAPTAHTAVAAWGRGVGKSFFVRLLWYLLVAEWDGRRRRGAPTNGVRIVLLMPTLEQAKKVHAALMLAELEGQWAWLRPRVNRTEWRVSFPGGSWIQWVTAERARNIRGLRCDAVFVDECDDVDREVVDAIVGPWLSEPHSLGVMMFSGTPTRGRYGLLYRMFQLGRSGAPGYYSSHATYRDVPEYVSMAHVERERAKVAPALFAREWECDFDAAEGLVYGLFREAFHVREPHPDTRWSEILVGVDHGYEDPGVFEVVGVAGSGADAVCYALEELHRQHETESFWVREAVALHGRLSRMCKRVLWYGDPSQPARLEAYRRAGVPIVAADNAVDEGVNTVADRLVVRRMADAARCGACDGGGCERCRSERGAYARLYASAHCPELIREMGLYRRRRDPRNRERVLDAIEDKHNHCADALRYALHTHFGSGSALAVPPPAPPRAPYRLPTRGFG